MHRSTLLFQQLPAGLLYEHSALLAVGLRSDVRRRCKVASKPLSTCRFLANICISWFPKSSFSPTVSINSESLDKVNPAGGYLFHLYLKPSNQIQVLDIKGRRIYHAKNPQLRKTDTG
ncbi:hypothetical protein ABW19_dt0203392 [Dactylella cylindrospora]|nr:hypothetical protein ABW19_dt0203392 [Dactylella cylindrospora]